MSNKETIEEIKSLNEAKEKAFEENNKIINKMAVMNKVLKITNYILGVCIIVGIVTALITIDNKNKAIDEYKEEMSCLNNKLTDTEHNRQELVDTLLDIEEYILPTCDANKEMIEHLYNKIDTLISWEYNKADYSDNPFSSGNISQEIMNHLDKPEIYIYPDVDEKPEIYIYPDVNMNKDENSIVKHVEIKLSNPEKLTCTYPKYENSWSVDVKADGTLVWNNREYYGLYWEGKGSTVDSINKGFCVKGSDTAEFLEEKLEILGLSEREANEFIIYWLPRMENNKYNVIYFATMEEQNNYMELDINPAPETLIRVNMVWYSSNKYIDIEEEKLEAVKRKGYTVVEWGGTELNRQEN